MIWSDMKHVPQCGDRIQGDQWPSHACYPLMESDGYSDSSYRGCEFRYNTHDYSVGVDIVVTGKPHIVSTGGFKSRVKVVVVGDGELDRSFGAWLYHEEA